MAGAARDRGPNGAMRDLAPESMPRGFPAPQLVDPQPVMISAADGLKLHGQLFLPVNVAGRESGIRRLSSSTGDRAAKCCLVGITCSITIMRMPEPISCQPWVHRAFG